MIAVDFSVWDYFYLTIQKNRSCVPQPRSK